MPLQVLRRTETEFYSTSASSNGLGSHIGEPDYPREPWPGLADGWRSVEPRSASEDLRRRIENFLAAQSVPGLRRLSVDIEGTKALLRGVVRTFYEKQLALHCCRRVAGVITVVDAIEVEMPEPKIGRG